MIPRRILFIRNLGTQYDILHTFFDSFKAALERQGAVVQSVLANDNDISPLLDKIYELQPHFLLGLNGPQNTEGMLANDFMNIPLVCWIVDSSSHYEGLSKSKTVITIFTDQKSADTMRQRGAAHSLHLPHAFNPAILTDPAAPRRYPIVFTGTAMDPKVYVKRFESKFPPEAVQALLNAANDVLSIPGLSFQTAFAAVAKQHSDHFHPLSKKQLNKCLLDFEYYIRALDRVRLLNALKDYPVHIFGSSADESSWENLLEIKNGHYTLHPGVPFLEVVKIMQQAEIVLNSCPSFKYGAHERIFYGIGAGAAVLTNRTPWIESHFTEGHDILLYDSQFPEKTASLIGKVLSNNNFRISMVRAGQAKILKEHTWDMRARQFLQMIAPILDELKSH